MALFVHPKTSIKSVKKEMVKLHLLLIDDTTEKKHSAFKAGQAETVLFFTGGILDVLPNQPWI